MFKFISIFLMQMIFLVGCQTNPSVEENIEAPKLSSLKNKKGDIQNSKEVLHDKELLLNYEQKEKGPYKITTSDIHLMKTYLKFVSYRIVKSNKKGQSDMYLPYYSPLKIIRSGKISTFNQWKVKVEETSQHDFTINGINSKGEKINQKCSTLLECLTII